MQVFHPLLHVHGTKKYNVLTPNLYQCCKYSYTVKILTWLYTYVYNTNCSYQSQYLLANFLLVCDDSNRSNEQDPHHQEYYSQDGQTQVAPTVTPHAAIKKPHLGNTTMNSILLLFWDTTKLQAKSVTLIPTQEQIQGGEGVRGLTYN